MSLGHVSVCSSLAEKIFSIAILLYVYRYFCGQIFSSTILRQTAYVLQTIKISLILASLLPFVVNHSLSKYFPNIEHKGMYRWTMWSLLGNTLVAIVLLSIIRLIKGIVSLRKPVAN